MADDTPDTEASAPADTGPELVRCYHPDLTGEGSKADPVWRRPAEYRVLQLSGWKRSTKRS